MRKQGLPWKEIFWKVWATMQVFKCVDCNDNFFGSDLHFCARHLLEPMFTKGANLG